MLTDFKKSRKKRLKIQLTSKGSMNTINLLKQALKTGRLPQGLVEEQLNDDSLFISMIQSKRKVEFRDQDKN